MTEPARSMSVKRHRAWLAQSGFTLLESTIAAALMSIGALAITAAQLTSIRHAEAATQRTLATQWAQQKLETVRFDLAAALLGTGAQPGLSSDSDAPRDVGNTTYLRRWDVSPASEGTVERRVSVTVVWQDRAGRAHDVELASVLLPTDAATLGAVALARPALTFFDIAAP